MASSVKTNLNQKAKETDPLRLGKVSAFIHDLRAEEGREGAASDALSQIAHQLESDRLLADLFFQSFTAQPDEWTIRQLLRLQMEISEKGVQKIIRRALYQLRQKGFKVQFHEEKTEGNKGSILKEIPPVPMEGHISEYDGSGSRMAALLLPQPQGGRIFTFALIGSQGGLEEVRAMETSKKEARRLLREMEEGVGQPFLAADAGHLAFLIKEAHQQGSKLSAEDEKVFEAVMGFIEKAGEVRPFPLGTTLFSEQAPDSGEFPDPSVLSLIPEVFYFSLNPGKSGPFLEEIKGVKEGVLILSEAQKRDQIQEIVRKAVRELFPKEEIERLKRFLEEAAYLYYLKNQRTQAVSLFQTASSLKPEEDKSSGKENPFLSWLVGKSLLPEETEKAAEEAAPEKRSEGGIILPSWVRSET